MNQIFRGDARDMKEIPTHSIHLVVTSPPYNVGVAYDGYDDNLHPAAYEDFTRDWLHECRRVMAHSARIAINVPVMGNSRRRAKGDGLVPMLPIFIQALQDNRFTIREIITWVKTHSENLEEIEQNFCGNTTAWGSWLSPSNPYCRSFSEHIIVAHKGAPKLAWQGQTDLTREEFLAWSRNVWLMPTATRQSDKNAPPKAAQNGRSVANHPAPFHVELPRRVIKLYSFIGDVVLDPFIGTGTTAYAASRLKRRYLGYDLSPAYAELARMRVAQMEMFP